MLLHNTGEPILVELKSPAPDSTTEAIVAFSGSEKFGVLEAGKLEINSNLYAKRA